MRGSWNIVAAASALACGASAQLSAATRNSTNATATLQPCGVVSASAMAYASAKPNVTKSQGIPMRNSVAMACLNSVPLHKDRSLGFIDWISPYFEFTSTLTYLKNPPKGWTLPGVDIYAGLEKISDNIKSGVYKNQYAFEKDLSAFINVLPRDFHMTLNLPLVNTVFTFQRQLTFTSVSIDGESLPQLYPTLDLEQVLEEGPFDDWAPSPVLTINGEPAIDLVMRQGLDSQNYMDADGIFNRMLDNAAGLSQNSNGGFGNSIGNAYGFSNDNTTYVFANGSKTSQSNVAILQSGISFKGINSGEALFKAVEIPVPTNSSSSSGSTTTPSKPATASLTGYPKPVVIHPDGGYTSGYFLGNSSIAVLAVNSFLDTAENVSSDPIQQQVISKFLAASKAAGKPKLIIDLQGNGGGSIPNGFDAFKQLFLTIQPFGATRFRSTPFVDYFSDVVTNTGELNISLAAAQYQTQAVVDVNGQDFASYKDFVGPDQLYGDGFTALTRNNFSDPLETIGNDIIVSGYYNMTNIPAQVFSPENMIIIHDGGCGSTCAIFAELMKSQGGVRSIAVGGRPQNGPMQGVTGSKGAQVQTFATYQDMVGDLPYLQSFYAASGKTLPEYNLPERYNISVEEAPLGAFSQFDPSLGARMNIKNNFHSSDVNEVPLQFTYEAANCRLFYTPVDVFEIANLWERVANVTWNGGKCIPGSSINSDNTLPKGPYDTVPIGPGAAPNVTMNSSPPGLVTSTGGQSGSGGNGTSTSKPSPNGAASTSFNMGLVLGVLGAALMM